ncbi:MAG TPA: tRNA pseudouridine(13) synthase TruD [Candidatus Nanoarchaeia archaeon]|nr:tRNA pseudouridine(13) synthase TruD [Candidatus Nanoarchaeia archaeon]
MMYILKELPEDFVVKEISHEEMKDFGKFSYYLLWKRNRNTLDVIKELAKRLHLSEKDIGIAGNKDKQAITEQMISIPSRCSKEQVLAIQLEQISLTFCGYGDKPISLGDLAGNSFEIIVRDLSLDNPLHHIPTITFIPNYFDEQRFSKKNAEIGRCIIKKDFSPAVQLINEVAVKEHLSHYPTDCVGALKKLPLRLLRMYVNAYQSFLWNQAVAVLFRNDLKKEVAYSLGTFVFPHQKHDIKVPLPGFDSKLMCKEVEEVMKKEGISCRDFIIKQIPELSLEGEWRETCVDVMDFSATMSDDELHEGKKKVRLTFTLPKGSYATIVVKSLFG